jgi:hypothetical protein
VGPPLKITEIAEAFSRHRFEETFRWILEDAEWRLIGADMIVGKAAIVSACEESATSLANTQTTFDRFRVITADDTVVVDSQARYVDEDRTSAVASCDIYEFAEGMISAITSYNVEIESGRG